MKKQMLFSSAFALTCLFSSLSRAQNYSLNLNGSSTYVDCGSSTSFNSGNIRTLECWVKFEDFSRNQEILSRSTGSSGIELLLYNSNLSFFCMYSPTVGSHVDYPLSNLSTGVWYHVAATWDGNKDNMRLYVNGVKVGTAVHNGDVTTTGVSQPGGSFMIGQWSQSGDSRLLKGTVDEVRVWSINRSATDIKGGMYTNYPANTAGLIAYYTLNESSGTTVTNMTNTAGLNGTVQGTSTRVVSPVIFAANALNFNGTNNKVTIPNHALFNRSSNGTVECWIHPSSFSSTYHSCIVGNRGSGGTKYSIHLSQTSIGLWNGSSYQTVSNNFVAGTWYHIALVSDTSISRTTVYVDGVSKGQLTNTFGTLAGQPLTIGASENSGGDGEWFAGDIDDVRIWSTLRTQQQISDNRNTPLTGTETGLIANYTFNTGINSSNNSGLSVAIDATSNNIHGTLTNFVLTSATSNYVASAVVILPVQLTSFAAAKKGTTTLLNWTTSQEQNSKSFVIERSLDGNHFVSIGTIAASRNSNIVNEYFFTDTKPAAGTNYYRLQMVDIDGKNSYTKTVAVQFPQAEIESISPNPASSILHYNVSSLQTTRVSVNIVSASGQKVQVFTTSIQAGSNNLMLDVSKLPAGNYTLQISNTLSGVTSSQQFSVVR